MLRGGRHRGHHLAETKHTHVNLVYLLRRLGLTYGLNGFQNGIETECKQQGLLRLTVPLYKTQLSHNIFIYLFVYANGIFNRICQTQGGSENNFIGMKGVLFSKQHVKAPEINIFWKITLRNGGKCYQILMVNTDRNGCNLLYQKKIGKH